MPNSHALLAPSASKRWLTCTPSARLEALEPDKESSYAREGSLAHSVAEYLLKHKDLDTLYLGGNIRGWWMAQTLNETLSRFILEAAELSVDLLELVETVYENYVFRVFEDYLSAKAMDDDAVLLVEERYGLEPYVPESFGSSDAIIIYGDTCQVYDLKYGKGVAVSAKGNTQMMLYGLGALKGPCELYDVSRVVMTIIQPRLGSESTDTITARELLDWAEGDLKPKALTAFLGDGELVTGAHCQFCKVAHKCRALKEKTESIGLKFARPMTLSDVELAEAMSVIEDAKIYIKALEDYAMGVLLEGSGIPGYKLVEGRSVSRISDVNAVVEGLEKAGYDSAMCFKEPELKGLTELKKLLRTAGYNQFVAPYVVKPQGKPTIVRDSDPRPVFEARADAAEEFKAQ